MKKIKLLVLLLAVASIECFGHAYCLNRSNCLSSVLQRRYVAVARTYHGNYLGVNWARDGVCSGSAFASSSKSRFGSQCAVQSAGNNSGAWSFSGWNNSNCSRGYEFSDLYNYYSMRSVMSSTTSESTCSITTNGQTLNSNTVTISALSGSIMATSGMISSFSVKAWLPANENDTTIDNSELLYNGTIVIRYGQVDLLGDFATDFVGKYSTTVNGTTIRVDFDGNNFVFRVPVPRGRSMNEVSIMGEVDGAPIAPGSNLVDSENMRMVYSSEAQIIQESQISFNVFPNPSSGDFMVTLKGRKATEVSVLLFDIDGKLVKNITKSELKQGEEVKISSGDFKSDLSSGKYFIVIDDGKELYSKQVIIK